MCNRGWDPLGKGRRAGCWQAGREEGLVCTAPLPGCTPPTPQQGRQGRSPEGGKCSVRRREGEAALQPKSPGEQERGTRGDLDFCPRPLTGSLPVG